MTKIEHEAQTLGISTATLRNWTRGNIKAKILSGKLKKLDKRANKLNSKKTLIPQEHIKDQSNLDKFNQITIFIQKNNIPLTVALFLLSINFLKREKLLGVNKQIKKEIESWFLEIKGETIKEKYSFLLKCSLPREEDVLGIFYQSLLMEGKKSQSGSYFTPSPVVNSIITDCIRKDYKVLDPCCGSGQFLLATASTVKNPLNIYGIDCDKTAVKIARLNLLTKFRDKNFVPNVFCQDTIFDGDKVAKDFDVIATNPPWGAYFSREETRELKRRYPQITSFESFSYFIAKSLEQVKNLGTVSFILPGSILNVNAHKDIREIILKNYQIKKIIHLGRIFKSVFTPAIRLDLEKKGLATGPVTIYNLDKKYKIQQKKWAKNHDFIFEVHSNQLDTKIIDKIYHTKHTSLKNNSMWALGIVTGNNQKFISAKGGKNLVPIYRGKDVERFTLKRPSSFIKFRPQLFQQVAPLEKYNAKEKLIYKFISKNLTFAYDGRQRLTLNSANVLIPQVPNYPIKVIAALFNSSLYQFLFQKKFSSIKVLRSHLEALPLPLWDKKTFSKIVVLVDKTMQDQSNFSQLDEFIMAKFLFSQKEQDYIKEEKK